MTDLPAPVDVYPAGMGDGPLDLERAAEERLRPLSSATESLVRSLFAAFPRQQTTDGNRQVYEAMLEDIPENVLKRAVRRCIQTEEWLPTVAAVRRAAAEITLGLPTEAEALAQIRARQEWARGAVEPGDDPPDPPTAHPLVLDAVEKVGGWFAFRSAENPEVLRGQFGRIYRGAREAAILGAQAGTPPPGVS